MFGYFVSPQYTLCSLLSCHNVTLYYVFLCLLVLLTLCHQNVSSMKVQTLLALFHYSNPKLGLVSGTEYSKNMHFYSILFIINTYHCFQCEFSNMVATMRTNTNKFCLPSLLLQLRVYPGICLYFLLLLYLFL